VPRGGNGYDFIWPKTRNFDANDHTNGVVRLSVFTRAFPQHSTPMLRRGTAKGSIQLSVSVERIVHWPILEVDGIDR
jgi:hypothetical protein